MAHDVDLIIRQKVREADSFPVPWRKDLIWQQVSLPARRKSGKLSYYAAAAVLVAGIAVSYFLQLSERGSMEAKILSLELAIKNKLELNNRAQGTATTRENNCDQVNRLVAATKQKRLVLFSKMKKNPSVEPQITIPVDEIVSPVAISHAELRDQSPVVIAEIAAETPLVNPIIGYIPVRPTVMVVSKKIKKSKIRFLKSPEPELASQVVESKWTIARIN